MTARAACHALRRLLADERGAVSTEYTIITALGLILAIAIGASAVAVQNARERSQELLRSNIP